MDFDQLKVLRSTFNSIPDRVSIQDRDYNVVWCNAAYLRALGMKAEQVIGQKCYRLVHGSDAPIPQCPQCSCVGNGKDERLELTDEAAGTSWELSASPWVDDAGTILGTVHIMRDVSGTWRARRDLQAANDRLDLANREVLAAFDRMKSLADRAQEACLAKSRFLGMMSHELRTPLNGIIGSSDILAGENLSGRARDFLEMIRKSADNLLELVNGILDYSRIEAGRMEIEERDFDLEECVDGVMDILAPALRKKRLAAAACVRADAPRRLRGDPALLSQVLLNLAENAVKFTESGHVVVSAGLEASGGGGASLRFEISDSGIGMKPGTTDALFEPFTQADNSTSRRFGGSGLGLAIVRRLVDLMGGRVGAGPGRYGCGSLFWCVIPFALASDSEKEAGDSGNIPGDSGNIPGTIGQDMRVGISGFDEAMGEALRWMLEGSRYELLPPAGRDETAPEDADILLLNLPGNFPEAGGGQAKGHAPAEDFDGRGTNGITPRDRARAWNGVPVIAVVDDRAPRAGGESAWIATTSMPLKRRNLLKLLSTCTRREDVAIRRNAS